jgi:hypothetical protein
MTRYMLDTNRMSRLIRMDSNAMAKASAVPIASPPKFTNYFHYFPLLSSDCDAT